MEAFTVIKSVAFILIFMESFFVRSRQPFRPDFEPVVPWLMESTCQISFQEGTAKASRNECALGYGQDLWPGERTRL